MRIVSTTLLRESFELRWWWCRRELLVQLCSEKALNYDGGGVSEDDSDDED